MSPGNERRRYIVTSSLIGWEHIQNDTWLDAVEFDGHVMGFFKIVCHPSGRWRSSITIKSNQIKSVYCYTVQLNRTLHTKSYNNKFWETHTLALNHLSIAKGAKETRRGLWAPCLLQHVWSYAYLKQNKWQACHSGYFYHDMVMAHFLYVVTGHWRTQSAKHHIGSGPSAT